MTNEEAIKMLISKMDGNTDTSYEWAETIRMAIKALETVEEFEKAQIITGGRLNGRTYAYKCGLEDGKRKALEQQPSDDCVSRQAVLDMAITIQTDDYSGNKILDVVKVEDIKDIRALPPVTPTQCIAAVRFSKEDLREICNERIEIECTHGTCKDCKHYYMDEDGCGYHCERVDYTRFSVYADFYCKDFEKRGSENDI